MSVNENNCQTVRELFSGLPEGSLKVLQITDTHLYAETEGTLLGMNTQFTLDEVLKMTNECGPVDLILSTGDLVHDASEVGYKRYQSIMERAGVPVYCIPGNHDVPKMMKKTLKDSHVVYIPSAVHNNWGFAFLDSTLLDSEGGHFEQSELDLLEAVLTDNRDKHVLVCMHHHPVSVNSEWMDTMLIDNASEMFKVIDQYDNVKGLLWGHIHQIFDKDRNGIPIMATPSTCIQFAPEQDDFGLDDEPPGCRWLALMPDGSIKSCVTRLSEMPDGLDYNSAGY